MKQTLFQISHFFPAMFLFSHYSQVESREGNFTAISKIILEQAYRAG